MERFMFATLVWKIYCMKRTMDRFSPTTDAKAKGDFVDLNVKQQQRLVAWLMISRAAWELNLIMEFKAPGYGLLVKVMTT